MLNTLVEACLDIGPAQCSLEGRLRMVRRSATSRPAARKLKLGLWRVLHR
jgi:hypothetical protein